MATGPLEANPAVPLAAERDELARRCAEAEAAVERLTAELASVRSQLAAADSLSLFDGDASGDRLTGDGSDPRVLSLVLGATAVVAGMVALLAMLNGKLFTLFGMLIVAITIGLAWGAARTRIIPIEVEVVRGVVYVKRGEDTHRFDLKKADTQVLQSGRPGDSDWSLRFPRKGLDSFVIDASMVDPHEFVRQLREFRPDL